MQVLWLSIEVAVAPRIDIMSSRGSACVHACSLESALLGWSSNDATTEGALVAAAEGGQHCPAAKSAWVRDIV
jgi:hypothetical protein